MQPSAKISLTWLTTYLTVKARSPLCFWAVRELGITLTQLARHLRISVPGIGYSVQRGAIIAPENGYRSVELLSWNLIGVTVYNDQLRLGRPAPDYGRSDASGVRVVLHGGKANLDFARFVYEQDKAGSPLTLDELLILNQLEIERRINTTAAGSLIQKPDGETRAILERLTEKGLIEAKGEKKGRIYHLGSMLYEHFGNIPGYVHTRGFDKIQQKQMVLTALEATKDGRITREEVAELCRNTKPKAYHPLKKMCDDGELEKRGKTRGTYYTRKRTKITRKA